MNKNLALFALALLGASFLASCGDEDTPQPIIDPVEPADTTALQPSSAILTGWTSATHVPPEGGRSYFADFHSGGETASVSLSLTGDGRLSLTYASTAWGTATFQDLEVDEQDGRYVLPAGTVTTILMERGAYGGNGGGEYELTLSGGSTDVQLTSLDLVLSASMNENHGSYELTFHQGEFEEEL